MAETGWKPLPGSQIPKGIATPRHCYAHTKPSQPLALHAPVWERGFAPGAAKQICMVCSWLRTCSCWQRGRSYRCTQHLSVRQRSQTQHAPSPFTQIFTTAPTKAVRFPHTTTSPGDSSFCTDTHLSTDTVSEGCCRKQRCPALLVPGSPAHSQSRIRCSAEPRGEHPQQPPSKQHSPPGTHLYQLTVPPLLALPLQHLPGKVPGSSPQLRAQRRLCPRPGDPSARGQPPPEQPRRTPLL